MLAHKVISRGLSRTAKVLAAIFMAFGARNAPAGLVQTNRTERFVTNLVEVRMQATKLITEYRTNWTQEVWNNIIDVYATNRVTKLYTNRIPVQVIETNYVKAYRTNLVARYVTNRITVDDFRTNFVQAYFTNVKTLHLTNWVAVLQFKTNWVNQPLTNLVTIDLPRPRAAAAAGQTESTLPTSAEPLTLKARRGRQLPGGRPAEVELTVRPNTPGEVRVQQWRVEREDGSMLLFGEDQEFRRALPVGNYKVEVKARQPNTNELLAAIGTLSVRPGDILLQQKPTPKWTSP